MDYVNFGSFIVKEDDDTGERLFSGGYVDDKDGGPMEVGDVLELDPACLPVGAIVKITSPETECEFYLNTDGQKPSPELLEVAGTVAEQVKNGAALNRLIEKWQSRMWLAYGLKHETFIGGCISKMLGYADRQHICDEVIADLESLRGKL